MVRETLSPGLETEVTLATQGVKSALSSSDSSAKQTSGDPSVLSPFRLTSLLSYMDSVQLLLKSGGCQRPEAIN